MPDELEKQKLSGFSRRGEAVRVARVEDSEQERAQKARDDRIGLWPQDLTRGFELTDNAAIGPDGQLIFPKLFRRCTDYLHDINHENFVGSLLEWMEAKGENDPVEVGQRAVTQFASLISQEGSRVSLSADLLALVFEGD